MEEEGYLALRWNSHNAVFAKILNLLREQETYTDVSLACGGRLYPAHKFVLSTCSDYFREIFSKTPCKHPVIYMKDVGGKDLEYLLDFMYKGEVHVAQNELGSLLLTAEGLQVKGLAVPDDAPKSVSSFHSNGNVRGSPQGSQTPSNKRKRPTETNKREDPPKLTPRPDLGVRTPNNIVPRMPELKRIKLEEAARGVNPPDSPSLSSEEPSSLPVEKIVKKEKISPEFPEYVCKQEEDSNYADDAFETHDGNGPSGPDENEESHTDGSPLSDHIEGVDDAYEQSNSSMPNSELSTVEMLQVDLNEDGTQIIIGPGGGLRGGSAASSVGDDDVVSDASKKPFGCPLCGHTFTRRDNLANHLKTHTGDRPFMCQYCHKCFSRKDYLKQHERIHTGEKPYACEICGRAFTRKEGLTDHMRCHSDFKAFACETCGKSFKQKCGLRFHKRNYKH